MRVCFEIVSERVVNQCLQHFIVKLSPIVLVLYNTHLTYVECVLYILRPRPAKAEHTHIAHTPVARINIIRLYVWVNGWAGGWRGEVDDGHDATATAVTRYCSIGVFHRISTTIKYNNNNK